MNDRTRESSLVQALHARLAERLPAHALLCEAEQMAPYCTDWLGRWRGRPALVALPDSVAQVAHVHRTCSAMGIPLVPQGGNTGMSGGATPNDSGEQVLISLRRMNRIRRICPVDNTLSVDAGVTLAEARHAASQLQRQVPLALGSDGSCTIGGNIATNAGGIQTLRWGTMRDAVLGLEVVLPDGRIWDGMRLLRKDNTGYDLKQLFIGSEGTLGTVTAAVLQLQAHDSTRATAWLHARDMATLVEALATLRQRCGAQLSAFEMMSPNALGLVERHLPELTRPVQTDDGVHALVELAGVAGLPLDSMLADALDGLQRSHKAIGQSVLAANASQAARMWALRESISLAQRSHGPTIKHDIALPLSAIVPFCEWVDDRLDTWREQFEPGLLPINFGHLGDGNLHVNLLLPPDTSPTRIGDLTERLNAQVHDRVQALGGSISAEHGIGQLRRAENRRYKATAELDLMLTIKRAFDPNLIMNPGKLF